MARPPRPRGRGGPRPNRCARALYPPLLAVPASRFLRATPRTWRQRTGWCVDINRHSSGGFLARQNRVRKCEEDAKTDCEVRATSGAIHVASRETPRSEARVTYVGPDAYGDLPCASTTPLYRTCADLLCIRIWRLRRLLRVCPRPARGAGESPWTPGRGLRRPCGSPRRSRRSRSPRPIVACPMRRWRGAASPLLLSRAAGARLPSERSHVRRVAAKSSSRRLPRGRALHGPARGEPARHRDGRLGSP